MPCCASSSRPGSSRWTPGTSRRCWTRWRNGSPVYGSSSGTRTGRSASSSGCSSTGRRSTSSTGSRPGWAVRTPSISCIRSREGNVAKARGVTVYVGTRKGAYAVESDGARRRWKVRGPYHKGNDVYQVSPDPRHPGTVYAGVNSVFFGPQLYRSTDEGRHWKEIAPPMMPVSKARPPPNFDVDPRTIVRPVKNIWQITPGPENEPKRLFVGIDPASLYRSDDGGASWEGVEGLNAHETRPKWNPGAGGCASTPSSSTRPGPAGCTWGSPRPGCSGPTTVGTTGPP